MKIVTTMLLIVCLPLLGIAQTDERGQRPNRPSQEKREMFELSGVIFEKDPRIPLEFATVILKPIRGQQVFGGLSNQKGKFKVDVPKGRYNISFEFLSFKTITIEDVEINDNMNLGEILLEENSEKRWKRSN